LILFQQFINNHLIPFNKYFVFIQIFQRAKHPSLSFHNPVRKQLMFSEANLGFHQLSHHLSMPHSVTDFLGESLMLDVFHYWYVFGTRLAMHLSKNSALYFISYPL
jgi:hypothetical protein